MANSIEVVKTVDAENFEFLLAQSDYKLNAVFRSKNPQVDVYPNATMTATHSSPINTASTTTINYADQSRSSTYDFEINATTNALIDLKDIYVDVNAFFGAIISSSATLASVMPITPADLRFSNQPLFPLFDNISLFVDNVLISRVNCMSLSANARYALEYPHSQKQEESFEVNGWTVSDYIDGPLYTSSTSIAFHLNENSIKAKIYDYSINTGTSEAPVTTYYKAIYGNICQKIKLSDIFTEVNTLPPIFNHKITVEFVRANSSFIGCDTRLPVKLELDAFETFKLSMSSYIITDQLKNACEKYYSKPIESLYTARTEMTNSIPSEPSSGSEMSFTINTNLAYKNKCLVLAFPRSSNSTGINQPYTFGKYVGDASSGMASDNQIFYSEFGKCFNDYTHGGIVQLLVTTGSGLRLADFHFDRDGNIQNYAVNDNSKWAGFDMNTNPNSVKIVNYLEAYEQYKKCRAHFNQLEDEAIDFIPWLKSYFMFCIDLSPFDLTAGEQIRINIKFGSWATNYNPFYFWNWKAVGTNNIPVSPVYGSSQILVSLYSDQILRLLPNQKVEIVQLFSETEKIDKNVNEMN